MTSPAPTLDSDFVAAALGQSLLGRSGPNREFTRAVIDSREVREGDLFVALPGEHHDGHDFAAVAADQGAAGLLVARPLDGMDSTDSTGGTALFTVADPLAALQRLGARWRDALPSTEVTAITGNVGKTTTKLITAAVLGVRYRVQASANNYNNEIGVPLCLLETRPETERAVVEMGMYTTTEIALLCEWARPSTGVVLNVGPVHLERAGSMEAIIAAKRELPEALPEDGHAILNADDADVAAMAAHTRARVWRFGESDGVDVRGADVASLGAGGFDFTLVTGSQSRRVHVPLAGAHLLSNVLAAAAAGLADGIEFDQVAGALEGLDVPLRLEVRPLAGGVTLLDDTYNANPASMLAALDLLAELPGRRIALLGDMRELGAVSDQSHDRAGERAAAVLDALYTVGELAERISAAARSAGLDGARHLPSTEAAADELLGELREGDILLVKGSRALALETVVRAIEDGLEQRA
ncbi:MAG: UDP-N-acetylmuramoyl-tripeptide--D-alanyl-D-alanine ligase [Dehalococcoidia bacterium]